MPALQTPSSLNPPHCEQIGGGEGACSLWFCSGAKEKSGEGQQGPGAASSSLGSVSHLTPGLEVWICPCGVEHLSCSGAEALQDSSHQFTIPPR